MQKKRHLIKPIHDKISQQWRNRGEFPQLVKEDLQKPTTNIILNADKELFIHNIQRMLKSP